MMISRETVPALSRLRIWMPCSSMMISGAGEFFFFGLMRRPCSSIEMSMLRLVGTRLVVVAMSQLKGGMLDRIPATIISRIESRMKRFQLIETSHSA